MQFLSTALSLCFCDVVTVYHLPQAQQRECVCVLSVLKTHVWRPQQLSECEKERVRVN